MSAPNATWPSAPAKRAVVAGSRVEVGNSASAVAKWQRAAGGGKRVGKKRCIMAKRAEQIDTQVL